MSRASSHCALRCVKEACISEIVTRMSCKTQSRPGYKNRSVLEIGLDRICPTIAARISA